MTRRLLPNAPRHTLWLSSAVVTAAASLVGAGVGAFGPAAEVALVRGDRW